MDQKTRRPSDAELRGDLPGTDGIEEGNRRDLQQEGESLLMAVDDVISKALSSDSSEFIRQGRQRGGQ